MPDASVSNPQFVTLRYRWETSRTRADTGGQTLTDSDWHLLTSAWAKPPGGSTYMSYWEVHSSNPIIMYVDDCALYEATSFDLTGRVLDGDGNGVDGVPVTATTTDYTSPAVTTSGGGYYTLIVQPGPFTYSVNTNLPGFTGGVSVAVSGTPTVAPDITLAVNPFLVYNFDTGLQGWLNLGGGTNTFISRTGGDMGAGQTLPNFVGIDNNDARDSSTSTLWTRSPAFILDTSAGDLTFYLAGGTGAGVAALPANDSLVPVGEGARANGFLGVALRDDVTGEFVLKASRTGAGSDWQQFGFTALELAAATTLDHPYTLDFIDTNSGVGWNWIALDSVSIPGALVPVTYTSVSGKVTEGGLGVAGAIVTASYPGGSVSSPGSAPNGSYTITNVPVGKMLTLTVSAGAKLPTYIPVPFSASDTNPITGVDITVAGTYQISGTVTNGGTPVAGLTVTAVGANTYRGTTLENGTYSITVVNDVYTVSVPAGLFSASPLSGIAVSGADVGNTDFALTSAPPLVDVNAASTTVGASVTGLTNNGTLGGVFIPGGPGSSSTAPLSTVVGGNRALYLDGTVGMGLVSASDSAVAIDAPAMIVGNYPSPSPLFTLVAWVWRSELDGNMGIFSWSPFFYGANFQYGNGWAADHFGSGNLAWSAQPAAGSWHQLVYTSDGTTEKVYADGVVAGSATAPTAFLNVENYSNMTAQVQWKGVANPITLGQIEDNDGYNWYGPRNFKGAIAAVRLYDFGVTATDVAALYASYKPEAGSGYNVTGYIYGPDGVTGLDGAQVSAKIGTSVVAGPVTTSGGGAYVIVAGPGTYDISASAPGYRSGSLTGVVMADADVPDQNLTLQAIPENRLAISFDASEATSAGVVNHGYYGGAFVPAQGTPTVGQAGPAADLRPAISFANQRWQLQEGSVSVLSGSDVAGNQPFTVVAWVYQDSTKVNQNAGPRNMYFTWAPLGAPGAAGCGLGWRTWGGAYPGFDSANTPVVCWDGYNETFSTALSSGLMPWDAWLQIVTMYDGTTLHFYKNGVEVVGGSGSSAMPRAYNLQTAAGNPFSLGGFSNGWGDAQYWGSIARLKMYSKTLTQSEIDEDLANPPGLMSPYASWASSFAGGQTAGEDYNNDGVSNGVAFFMGMDGLATNPGIIDGKVTWPRVGAVTSFGVEVSIDLLDWSPANPADIDTSNPTRVVYTLPKDAPKKFGRLVVTP